MWKNVTDTDKKHAKIVYQEFRTKNVGTYYVLFIQCDKFLLPDVFISFPNICLKIHELDPTHFFLHQN